MSRTFSQYHTLRLPICLGIEFLLFSGVVMLAAVVRFSVGGWAVESYLPYLPHAVLTALVSQLSIYYVDLYDLRVVVSGRRLFIRLLQALIGATVVLMVIFYLLPQLFIGRGILLPSMIVAFFLIAGWRLLYQHLHALTHFQINILILGTGAEARKLAEELVDKQPLGYELRGFIGERYEVDKNVL
jgi:FlaA1/EpsC-like NDP-sugar epimerase